MGHTTLHQRQSIVKCNGSAGIKHYIEISGAALLPGADPADRLAVVEDQELARVTALPVAVSGLPPVFRRLALRLSDMEGKDRIVNPVDAEIVVAGHRLQFKLRGSGVGRDGTSNRAGV